MKKKYTVLDLFCGAGGMSLGFEKTERVTVVSAIDFSKEACKTYQYNFKKTNVICKDIKDVSIHDLNLDKEIDLIIGGPPCQGFSGLNRWNKDLENDPRNELFREFLRFVEELRPKVILIENVRQILTSNKGKVKEAIYAVLNELGYSVESTVLNASDFGVPQNRNRAFFIGTRNDIQVFKLQNLKKYMKDKITVYDAISDIAEIEEDVLKAEKDYYLLKEIKSCYQKLMRKNSSDKLYNHLMYYPTQSVIDKIVHVKEGENWKVVPEYLFKSKRENRHSNYLRRFAYNSQATTIDTGHNVYFHPKYNRVPTIRESARLQSFPDDFIFLGNKGAQFRQVGNAVPPLLSFGIAQAIIELLDKNIKKEEWIK
ncbi:DNA cytosine methyltransferase [Cetobacterium sp.]|uniref:DNA cytosine methyltransferase n=1 Tax=Cetobacterium sp. TaxID=2071632 RepID=UPI003F327D5F